MKEKGKGKDMAHVMVLEVIERWKAKARMGRVGIAVFDLDSTLFNTGPRNYSILREFANIYQDLHPILDQMNPHQMGYNLEADLRAHGLKNEEILGGLKQFWRDRFFTDAYVVRDAPYRGARRLVERAVEVGMVPYYLTGRDHPNMREGTIQSLKQHGFPMDETAVLKMKPRWEDDDAEFKQAVVGELNAMGEVVLAFENEPGNANLFKRAFPGAVVALHETICAPNPPPLDGEVLRLASLEGFED
jgi:hypothetical protein